jgi:hypothetical protein
MKVHELIAALSHLPPDLEVMVRAYEGGVDKVVDIAVPRMYTDFDEPAWYYGAYDQVTDGDRYNPETVPHTAAMFEGVQLVGGK